MKTNSRRCVLGLIDVEKVHDCFHEYFIDQLQRLEEGGYCTRLLPWKPDHACLPPNKELTLGRLKSMTRKLESRCKDLKTVVEQQLEKGILEVVPEIANGEAIHYNLHQLLMKDQAESRTKDEDSV